jgi:glycosyltransferase involved in cell wall biosynthesis
MKDKKITYISTAEYPSKTANSLQVMKMCQAFRNNNINLELVIPDNNYKENYLLDYYNIKDKFQITKIKKFNKAGGGYIYSLTSALLSKKKNINIVYCRDFASAYFSLKLSIPTFLEIHGTLDNFSRVMKFMFKSIIKEEKLIKIVVITNTLKEYYDSNFPELKDKILVLHDGADEVEPLYLNNQTKKNDRFQVGYVGHLYKGKGMEIISSLAPLCEWTDFHIVGGLEKDLNYWKEQCKEFSNIYFHGFINQKELGKYFRQFDVVLLPNQKFVTGAGNGNYNISNYTSPLKLFEYMSYQKAIVASDLEVLKEVLINKGNALLCKDDDVNDWKNTLELLKNDTELRKKISLNAYEDFLKNYTWKARVKKIIESYEAFEI